MEKCWLFWHGSICYQQAWKAMKCLIKVFKENIDRSKALPHVQSKVAEAQIKHIYAESQKLLIIVVKKMVKVVSEIKRIFSGRGPGRADGGGSCTILSSS